MGADDACESFDQRGELGQSLGTMAGPATLNGKASRRRGLVADRTQPARISRHGRLSNVRLTARARGGVAATYVVIGKGSPHRYLKPLKLTAKPDGGEPAGGGLSWTCQTRLTSRLVLVHSVPKPQQALGLLQSC